MRTPLILATALIASSAQAQMAPYQGEWGIADLPDCMTGMVSTCPAIRFQGMTMLGEESACDFVPAGTVAGTRAEIFDAACRGEGESWGFRAILLIDSSGFLTIMTDDYTMRYARTAEAPAATPVK